MSERLLFISDLHLEEARPDITEALLAFLERNKADCKALYILGDLFEVWIGDDEASELSERVASALASFRETGSDIFIVHGNRDFLLGERYASRCGAELMADSTVIPTPIGPALVLHGDDLCTDDVDYIQFRETVRQEAWQRQFLAQSLEERRAFAQAARQQSRQATSSKENSIMDVNAEAVKRRLQDTGQNLMLHGHTHRPKIHTVELELAQGGQMSAKRIVLGDWDSAGWYLEITSEGLSLESFPLKLESP